MTLILRKPQKKSALGGESRECDLDCVSRFVNPLRAANLI